MPTAKQWHTDTSLCAKCEIDFQPASTALRNDHESNNFGWVTLISLEFLIGFFRTLFVQDHMMMEPVEIGFCISTSMLNAENDKSAIFALLFLVSFFLNWIVTKSFIKHL
jgi:hypothetical protein